MTLRREECEAIGAAIADQIARGGVNAGATWNCPRCGSHRRWVAASLTGGLTRIRQCVPCGYYSGDPVEMPTDGVRDT